jgi:hypothetical protein
MNLEILVEEPSAERALSRLVPRIVGPSHGVAVHSFRNKFELLAKLTGRLTGYSSWIGRADTKVVVLIDRDNDDCIALKSVLEKASADAGLRTFSAAGDGPRDGMVLNRIVVEELEAWFLGDIPALRAAYPRLLGGVEFRAKYRDPDAVAGGTWEALEDLLRRFGYFPAGLAKTVAAAAIAEHMNVEANRSRSFQAFRDGLRRLVGEEPHA